MQTPPEAGFHPKRLTGRGLTGLNGSAGSIQRSSRGRGLKGEKKLCGRLPSLEPIDDYMITLAL